MPSRRILRDASSPGSAAPQDERVGFCGGGTIMAKKAPKIDQSELRRRALARRRGERFGRGDRSALGTWFWEIDRVLLLLVTLLIGIGLIAVAAAAPAAAQRYSDATHIMPARYYFFRQLMWTGLAVPVMIGVSMLPK